MLVNLGLAASLALAATADAILLPPQLAADSIGDDLALETLAIDPSRRTVALECPGCPKATVHGEGLRWTPDVGNLFVLHFNVGAEQDTLELDGVQLYPPPWGPSIDYFSVTQLDPLNADAEPLRLRVNAWSFNINSAETVSEDGNELLPMTIRIKGIENTPVNVPAITINILKDASGRLMIASFESRPVQETPASEECTQWPLYCEWKSLFSEKYNDVKVSVEDKIKNMKDRISKGCHKHKNQSMHGGADGGASELEMRPGHHHPHHPHHRPHHGGHHGAYPHGMMMLDVFLIALTNIILGFFVGTLVFLVVRALACLITLIVSKARGQSAYEAVESDDEEDNGHSYDDKEVYVPLPEYEAPPVYEEAAEKQVVTDEH
ncbi:hypothetical protein M011DRAFT_518857 [Sporormia fimetaria CBS 119925]|uniref:DUF7728 domain-containing protein n=1 Tax=Sporormia fimetaria CBS 119925 TaxID=1340428 RepID=A0A6A6VC67_9PLEO|nr:hypothetical protein M011DRAFT_518857 [Sporormia fimetaria CBS 119925]